MFLLLGIVCSVAKEFLATIYLGLLIVVIHRQLVTGSYKSFVLYIRLAIYSCFVIHQRQYIGITVTLLYIDVTE